MEIRGRRRFLWDILIRPSWKWLVFIPLAVVLNFFIIIRDEFLPEELQKQLQTPNWLPNWPWYQWVIITLVLIILIILESAYRYSRSLRTKDMKPEEAVIPSDRLFVIQKVEDPFPSDFWVRVNDGMQRVEQDNEARIAKQSGKLFLRVSLGLTAIPSALIENIEMEILGSRKGATNWRSREIEHTDLIVADFDVPMSLTAGAHSIKFFALFDGEVRYSDEYILDFP